MASESKPYTLRWGLLSCGWIAKIWAIDVLLDPTRRGASDVKHIITAAATRNSASRAKTFLDEIKAPGDPKAYGSYKELVADPDVDIVYISTPHSHHYQHARLALETGKHVLCEKAFTVNAKQAQMLVDLARKKGLFLLEAVWTRWFPLMKEVSEIVSSGKIGELVRVFADVSRNELLGGLDDDSRLVKMDLAGGALLDLGVYSITWVFQFLYHLVPGQGEPSVVSSVTKYAKTGSDETASMIMTFPKGKTQGIATCSLKVAHDPDERGTAGPVIRIQCTKGEVQIYGPGYRPEKYRVIPTPGFGVEAIEKEPFVEQRGMYWEADECARCLRDGKLESSDLSPEESVVIMKVLDEVRRQNGIRFPDSIESAEYPLEGF